jgi:pimeloyl-ACP methyl ester carboxylesterase
VICGGWYSWQGATFAREESDCLFIQNAVVLLPHGLGANGALELGTAAALTKNFGAIISDQIGHGASEKPAVTYRFATFADFNQELLESLGVKRAVVVGESLGEWIAADVVLRFPETFTKLAIADSAGVTLDSRVISPKDFREHYISSNYDLRKLEIGCAASRSCRANTVAGRD